MFSPATIASSTTMPSARMKANRLTMLMETPSTGMKMKVPMNATGMPIVTQNASLNSRNRLSSTSTRHRPMKPFFSSRSMRCW